MTILDFHTHHPGATAALIAVDPRQFAPQPGLWYSVGYHPWHNIDTLTDADYETLRACSRHPQVIAIGETGIDRTRGAALDVQAEAFVRHLQLAHESGLPVVVHNVKATQDILSVRRQARLDEVTLAIHGMRANGHVARTLLDAGCYLSFGPKFNPEALRITPPDRLLVETDDSTMSISEVVERVALALHLTPEQITETAAGNAQRLLSHSL
ncbi:MAG: TatD family hydrolase [Muribaculaceae bacterium]|nr:TatD family hydrolase [Muribaculaceae bacterium]